MKKVLVVYYSQSGQLTEIVKNITCSLQQNSDAELTYHHIRPLDDYPFPWTKKEFFDVFPESFLQIPCDLHPIEEEVKNTRYDLVVLAYQVWYLSPSIPINSFLKSKEGKEILKDTPVVTVIGCRNMWFMAQEKVKELLKDAGGILVGNIALVDRHINHISVITIVKWMFSGVKKRYLGVFPKPGVSQEDIDDSVKYGNVILPALLNNNFQDLQGNLLAEGAVKVKPGLVLVDKRANRIFEKWAQFIYKKGIERPENRAKWLIMFKYYLIVAIWAIAPIVNILFLILYLPLLNKIRKEKDYYSSVSFTK